MARRKPTATEQQLKVAIYTRVSTERQAEEGDSLEMQTNELYGYAQYVLGADRDHCVLFPDEGKSGKDIEREKFKEMMLRVRSGEFSHILIYKLDRLSRSARDLDDIFTELDALNVQLVSKVDSLDTNTPSGRFFIRMLSSLAQLEREQTADRVRDVMISRANKGTWNGGHVPYGYGYINPEFTTVDGKKVKTKDGEIYVDVKQAAIVRRMFSEYDSGQSVTDICVALNREGIQTRAGNSWTSTTVWKVLTNIWYTGDYRYNVHRTLPRVRKDENGNKKSERKAILTFD